ncbi:MAG: dehydratase [Porticoccaceae bacterium]|nr:MAG: dehydratase [Porticoccaceae bacterium]
MITGHKVLVTGASGKIAFPIARALAAAGNEVWGLARLARTEDRQKLEAAGVRPIPFDLARDDLARLPDDFDYVFHAAVDPGLGDWRQCVEMNAQRSGDLFWHCRGSRGFVYCSTGSIYAYQGPRPLREDDPPGIPLRANYSFSKVAGEELLSWISRTFGVPLTIIRICSTYGPEGGAPADRLEAILEGRPIPLHPDRPNRYNPIYEDDYVALGIRALEVAAVPPVVVNWAGSETVSIEAYCTYLGQLVGREPVFVEDPTAHPPLWPDTTRMHQILGRTRVPWREGMRRMVRARHPEIPLPEEKHE